MATIGKLNILVTAGTAGLKAGLSQAGSLVAGFGRSVGGLLGTLGSFATSITGVGTAAGALAGIAFGMKLAGDVEQATMAFEVMFGSAEKAKNLIADMREFAAQTPFETSDLIKSGRVLSSFGVTVENIMPSMKMLGDVAAGVGAPLDEIAELFGKVSSTGRVSSITMKQFALRGVPLMKEFAKQFNVSEQEVAGLVEEGRVGFPELVKALQSATGAGGVFENMMARQSTTFLGLLSTLKDNAMIALTDFSQMLIDVFGLKDVIGGLNDSTGGIAAWVESLRPVFERVAGYVQTIAGAVWAQLKSIAAPLVAIKDVVVALFQSLGIGADQADGVLKKVLQTLINWLPSAARMRAVTLDAIEGIATGLTYLGGGLLQFAGWVTKYLGEPLLTWTAKGIRALGSLYGVMSNLPGLAGQLAGGAKIGAGIAADFVEGMAGQAVGAGERLIDDGSVARIQERVAKVRGFFDGLRNPIAAVGDEAAKTQQKIGEFKLGKVIPADLIDKAKKLKESLVSPAESFRIQTRELNQMLANGLINQRQFALASVRIAGELDKAINKGPDKGPEALISGSREAVSAILRFQRDGRKDDPLQRIAKTLEEAKRIEERTAKAAEDTARALKVLGNPVIVGI